MPQLPRIGSWTKVPSGSKLRIGVSGTTAQNMITTKIFLLRSDGFEQTIPDSSVQPGPVDIPLDFPHLYSAALDVHFVTAATAVVKAEVVSPAGNVIPQDGAPPPSFQSNVVGTAGDTSGFTFFVSTGPV